MFRKLFKKYIELNKVICVMLALYMLNAFTLVNLLVNFSADHTLNIGSVSKKTGETNFYALQKVNSKALYLFISRGKSAKSAITNQGAKKCPIFFTSVKLELRAQIAVCKCCRFPSTLDIGSNKCHGNIEVLLI